MPFNPQSSNCNSELSIKTLYLHLSIPFGEGHPFPGNPMIVIEVDVAWKIPFSENASPFFDVIPVTVPFESKHKRSIISPSDFFQHPNANK